MVNFTLRYTIIILYRVEHPPVSLIIAKVTAEMMFVQRRKGCTILTPFYHSTIISHFSISLLLVSLVRTPFDMMFVVVSGHKTVRESFMPTALTALYASSLFCLKSGYLRCRHFKTKISATAELLVMPCKGIHYPRVTDECAALEEHGNKRGIAGSGGPGENCEHIFSNRQRFILVERKNKGFFLIPRTTRATILI